MIVTVTLNPAMDRLLFVDGFEFNITNRIYRRENCVGGKGTHVSANLACLKERSIATGIAMGPTGREIIRSLEGLGVACDFVFSEQGDSRTNYILLDGKTSTLICERGPEMRGDVLEAFARRFDKLTDSAEYVIISGDASNFAFGAGFSLQDKMIDIAQSKGVLVVLDSAGASLKAGVEKKPYLIKPNAEELAELTGMPADTDEQIISAIRSLDGCGIEIVAVSMGSRGSIVKYGDHYYRAGIAKVEAINTVGCGDAYLSGLVYAIQNGYPAERALALAAACGGAAALNPLSVGFNRDTALALCDKIETNKLED
jgi:1-phosphofructokinase family hexose kinase